MNNQLNLKPLESIVSQLLGFIDSVVVPLILAIAFIVFIWGVFQYFIAGGANEEKRAQGRQFVMWGLIGFFIIVSIWGIVNLLVSTFNFENKRPALPTFGASKERAAPSSSSGTAATPTGNAVPE